jgi:TrmH family RNA methyltransferase
MSALLASVHVVLLRTEKAGNLGAVARAMRNFGLSRLTLVDTRVGSLVDAYRMAVHAHDVLDGAARTSDLAAAIGDARWVVGTTNRPPEGMRVLTPREVAEQARERGAPTLLFGGELHGLTQAELLRCHAASTIPVASAQSSVNLAQAVCVYAAELFAAHGAGGDAALPLPAAVPADPNLMHRLEQALRHLLQTSAWRDANRPDNAIAELMQPFFRAGLTAGEVRAWLTALNKAAQASRTG